MKKLTAILLCVLMLMGMTTAFADAESWICPECGKESDGNFCPYCGAKKPETEITCTSCGEVYKLDLGYVFCPNCGAVLEKHEEEPVKETVSCSVDFCIWNMNTDHLVAFVNENDMTVETLPAGDVYGPRLTVKNLSEKTIRPVVTAILNGEEFAWERMEISKAEEWSFVITENSPAGEYDYTFFVDGNEAASGHYTVKSEGPLGEDAPMIESVIQMGSKVIIHWKEVPGAENYTVYRSEDNENYSKIGLTIPRTSYTCKTCEEGKTYFFKVSATGYDGREGPLSKAKSIDIPVDVFSQGKTQTKEPKPTVTPSPEPTAVLTPEPTPEPITLHIKTAKYAFDATVADVTIEDGELHVSLGIKNNDKWAFEYNPPLCYALMNGKKYEVDTYNATQHIDTKGITLSSLTYNIPYKSSTLPDQILMDVSGKGDYQLIWNNPA